MPRHSFIESIANERSNEPLLDPSKVSSQIRRRLLHGQSVTERAIAEEFGKSNGLVQAVTELMAEWGFEIDHFRSETGERHFRVKNIDHVPTTRVKRVFNPRPRRKGDAADLKKKFLAGEPMTVDYVREHYIVGASYLHTLATRLENAGYTITREGMPATYRVVAAPEEPTRTVARRKGNGVAKANGRSNGHTEMMASMVPAFLSDLRVIALAEGDDGEIMLGLRGGDRKWTATLTGFHEMT